MNRLKKSLLLLLAILLCICCTACVRKEKDPPMKPDDPENPDNPIENPEEPALDGNKVTLKTADSVMVLEAADSKLSVLSLKTAGGTEVLSAPSDYALPERVKTDSGRYHITWNLVSVKMAEDTENSVPYQSGIFSYESDKFPLALTVTVLARPSLAGPFEIRSEVKNKDSSDMRLLPGAFASLTVETGGDLISIKKESGVSEGYRHYDGTFFEGSGIYRTKAQGANVNAWVNTFQNFNSSGYLPMIYLDKTDCGVYCALEWSSGRVHAKGGNNGVTFSVDMDEVSEGGGTFSTIIPGGKTFVLPSVYFGVYDGSLDTGSNQFKHWFFACKAPAALRDNSNEPLTQMDMQTGLSTYGIESIKWDYGWWSNDTLASWKTLEGSWKLRNKDYIGVINGYNCTTLADFAQEVKNNDLNWTVYLLLHDTLDTKGKVTDIFSEFNSITNPEWFSNRKIANGMGCSADLGNEECVDYLKDALVEFFGGNGIGTWRSDFEPICYTSDKSNRHDAGGTDVMYWCTYGFREVVEELYKKVNGFRYESCSSGGSMKDLFTATLAVSINTDDGSNYMGMRATFYDSSYVIHPAQLQMPCNSDFFNPAINTFWPKTKTTADSDFDFQKAMLDMGYRTQCLGSPMFSSWTATCMTDYYATYAEMYVQKIRPLVRDGELYHILPRPDGTHYDGVMYADPDSANQIKGLVFLFKPSEEAGSTCHLQLQGLDAQKNYQLTFEDRPEQNCTATGAQLMSTGLDVTIEYVGSELIWISEVK